MPDNSRPIPAAGIPSRARLVASVSSRAPSGSAANRWHCLDLWADSGRYWLAVAFRSAWKGDTERVRVFPLAGSDLSALSRALASCNPCHDYAHDARLYRQPAPGFPSKAHRIDHAIRTAFEAAGAQLARDAAAWFHDSSP